MCGRYALADPQAIAERFHIGYSGALLIEPRYNVAPTHVMPVVTNSGALRLMRWGLMPRWAKDPRIGSTILNARAETLAAKPTFKKLLATQRCLVPASGFYEWQHRADPPGDTTALRPMHGAKVPFYIHLKTEALFGFAGLYERWRTAAGVEELRYTIITTAPNALMAPIHDRMPAILRREEEQAWLNPDETEASRLLLLLAPYPAERMERYPVSAAVNNPRNDAPALVQPQPATPRER